ncbi:hypothetical protein ACLOJK_020872 [Asimina triloba]
MNATVGLLDGFAKLSWTFLGMLMVGGEDAADWDLSWLQWSYRHQMRWAEMGLEERDLPTLEKKGRWSPSLPVAAAGRRQICTGFRRCLRAVMERQRSLVAAALPALGKTVEATLSMAVVSGAVGDGLRSHRIGARGLAAVFLDGSDHLIRAFAGDGIGGSDKHHIYVVLPEHQIWCSIVLLKGQPWLLPIIHLRRHEIS